MTEGRGAVPERRYSTSPCRLSQAACGRMLGGQEGDQEMDRTSEQDDARLRALSADLSRRPRLRSEAQPAGLFITRPTVAMGVAAVGTAAAFLGVELTRMWRLGSLAETAEVEGETPSLRRRSARLLRIAREGYGISRARRNAVFNMLVSFMVTLTVTRGITVLIRTRGGIGPIRNVQMGDRHVHHFVPGMLLCFVAGGVAVGSRNEQWHRWLAVPFGGGVALVLDETALLLELEDVYWTEEGVLSLQVAFACMALLAAAGYGVQFLRAGNARLLEADWQAAARAWADISLVDAGA